MNLLVLTYLLCRCETILCISDCYWTLLNINLNLEQKNSSMFFNLSSSTLCFSSALFQSVLMLFFNF